MVHQVGLLCFSHVKAQYSTVHMYWNHCDEEVTDRRVCWKVSWSAALRGAAPAGAAPLNSRIPEFYFNLVGPVHVGLQYIEKVLCIFTLHINVDKQMSIKDAHWIPESSAAWLQCHRYSRNPLQRGSWQHRNLLWPWTLLPALRKLYWPRKSRYSQHLVSSWVGFRKPPPL